VRIAVNPWRLNGSIPAADILTRYAPGLLKYRDVILSNILKAKRHERIIALQDVRSSQVATLPSSQTSIFINGGLYSKIAGLVMLTG